MIATPESGASRQESGEIKESQGTRKVEDFDVATPDYNRKLEQLKADAKRTAQELAFTKGNENFPTDVAEASQREASSAARQLVDHAQQSVDQGFGLKIDLAQDGGSTRTKVEDAETLGLPQLAAYRREPSAAAYRAVERALSERGFEHAVSTQQKEYFVRTERKKPTA